MAPQLKHVAPQLKLGDSKSGFKLGGQILIQNLKATNLVSKYVQHKTCSKCENLVLKFLQQKTLLAGLRDGGIKQLLYDIRCMRSLKIINLAGCVLLFGPVIKLRYLWELGYHK